MRPLGHHHAYQQAKQRRVSSAAIIPSFDNTIERNGIVLSCIQRLRDASKPAAFAWARVSGPMKMPSMSPERPDSKSKRERGDCEHRSIVRSTKRSRQFGGENLNQQSTTLKQVLPWCIYDWVHAHESARLCRNSKWSTRTSSVSSSGSGRNSLESAKKPACEASLTTSRGS